MSELQKLYAQRIGKLHHMWRLEKPFFGISRCDQNTCALNGKLYGFIYVTYQTSTISNKQFSDYCYRYISSSSFRLFFNIGRMLP